MIFIYMKKKKKRQKGSIFFIRANLMNLMQMLVSKSVMGTQLTWISFILLFSCLLGAATSVEGYTVGTYMYHVCEGVGKFSTRGDFQYQVNLNNLLFSQFIDNGIDSLFYSTTSGVYPKVYGLYACRGDISVSDCKACVYQAGQEIFLHRCTDGKNAMIWAKGCFIRYANTSFVSKMVRQPEHVIWSERNTPVKGDIDLAAINMFRNLTENATSSISEMKFATTVVRVRFMEQLILYGFVQCTQDISRSDCKTCLDNAINFMFSSKHEKEGGRYLCPSCVMKYETFLPTTPAMPPRQDSGGSESAKTPLGTKEMTKTSAGRKGWNTLRISIGVSVSVTLLLVLTALYLVYLRRKRKLIKKDDRITRQETKNVLRRSVGSESLSGGTRQKSSELPLMSFDVISVATRQFSDENKLGEGGFGPVYKGTLPNGEEIAVKRHIRTSGQGLQEYENEVSLIANLQHRNLVKLLGCCLEGIELLLIYEYMPNKSLDIFLSDPAGNKKLDWRTRFSIINGIARGVLYLHEDSRLRIIHRDLKASNILLDQEMNPKISDFGMARVFCRNQKAANTNRVMGTYGYMAPEYAMEGLFSVNSDVYSFGVLILEIISGKKNSGFYLTGEGLSLVNRAWNLWSESESQGLDLLDPSLKNSDTTASCEVLKCIHVALLCVQDDPADRPTMLSVVLMLGNENTITLPQPSEPTFTVQRFNRNLVESTPKDVSTSVNDVTISTIFPR